MQTDKPSDPSDETWAESPEPRQPSRWRKPRSGRLSSGLALILSIIAVTISVYLWYALIHSQPRLLETDVPGSLARLDNTTEELKEALVDAEGELQSLRDTQDTVKSALEKIQSDLSKNRSEWVISEAEQLLLIANRRLQLARDVNSALAALQAADRQLELIANPNLLPVRRQISREIALLESIERTDVAGISLKLNSVAESVDRLPLSPSIQPVATADTEEAPNEGSARRVWKDLLSLVRIRYNETADRPLLPPEQQYFARENLRLMLYGAQHALLQGNVPTYHENLKTASRWLGDYFDTDAQAVSTLEAELEGLRTTPLMAELPDITNSLELLRKTTGRKPKS
jgi:uroporphyrin-III C-methyltransferase